MTNNLEYALAMMQTENLLSVIRRLRSVRSNGSAPSRTSTRWYPVASLDEDDVESGSGGSLESPARRTSSLTPSPSRSRAYTDTVSTDPAVPAKNPLVFERHKSAYRLSISNRDVVNAAERAIVDDSDRRKDVSVLRTVPRRYAMKFMRIYRYRRHPLIPTSNQVCIDPLS